MLTSKMKKVLRYINSYNSHFSSVDTWIKTRDVAEHLGESIYIARRELLKLAKRGYIIRTDKSVGNSTRWFAISFNNY